MHNQNRSTLVRNAALSVAVAMGAAALTPHVASAQVQTRTWVGETSEKWNDSTNWSTGGAPLDANRLAVFDALSTYQPAISTHVTVIAGIWMTGDTVGDVTITSDPTGQNGGKPTFQTNGNTIDGINGVGILIDNTSDGALTINTSAFKFGGNQSWINNSSNLFTLVAPANLDGKALTISGSGDTLISGNVTGSGSASTITKSGSGTLATTGALSYSGATTVTAGTLLINGSLNNHDTALVTVNGGILGGTGTIGRATTINEDGTLAPGVASDVAGTLTVNRNLTLNGAAAFDLVDTDNHDGLLFNAANENNRTLTLGGTLLVQADPGITFAAGQVFDLIDWGDRTTVSGRFDDVTLPTLGGGLSWQMFGDQPFDYETGAISVVPEPAGFALLLPAAALLVRRRRNTAG